MVRAVVFLVLAGLLVLGAVEFGPAAMERLGMASPAADGGAADEAFAKLEASLAKQGVNASDLSDSPPAADEAAPEPRQTYRYFDGSGTMHFVDALEKVPEPFRASAKPMGGSELPQLTRAAKTKVHRPSGYGTSIRKIPRGEASSRAQAPAARARGASEVVLYSTSWCGWCRKTMAWLDERGIDYENRDIEKNDNWRDELIEKTGKTSIPMVEIDGEIIQGFNPDRMGELL
jgi:glutaredoxin